MTGADSTSRYRFPAEWEPHASTWMVWPHNGDTWPGRLPDAQCEFESLVKTIARFEPVRLFSLSDQSDDLQNRFGPISNVDICQLSTNDSWIRDFGPTMVWDSLQQKLVGVCWRYNGWGEKYPPFDLDQKAASTALNQLDIASIKSQLVIEGGALETNGQGTVLTTSNCLYHSNRNPDWTPSDMETELREKLGADHLVVLTVDSIPGDDTDGHIDQVARFVNSNTIVVSADQPDVVRQLQQQTDFIIRLLPVPQPIYLEGYRLPASYANFYFCNRAIMVPQFDVEADKEAVAIFGELLPDREVIGLSSRALSLGLGSFHCLTQQQPQCDWPVESV